jgi:hypothetical protein
MAFKSTQKIRQYALNPELMADKHPNFADLIEELQASATGSAALVNELKAQFNALLAKLDDDAGVTDTNYEATLAVAEDDIEV